MSGLPHPVADDVANHMDRIVEHWKPGAKITVIVRIPGDDEGRMDFIMTADDPVEIQKVIARRIASLKARAKEQV